MPTVSSTVTDGAGNPVAGAQVVIRLIAATPETTPAAGFVGADDETIVSQVSLVTNGAGLWSTNLVANSLITPAGSYYVVTERPDVTPRRPAVKYRISVPNGAGPWWAGDLLVNAPDALPAVASVASAVSSNPTGAISATNVQAALAELENEKVAKSGDTMTGGLVVPTVEVSGKNSLSARRLAGRKTTAGAPTTGTWAVNDEVLDSNGTLWRCTVAGTPGTWVQASAGTITAPAATGVAATDTAALAAAVAAYPAGGGVLNAPIGTWLLNAVLDFVSFFTWLGSYGGRFDTDSVNYGTVLKWSGATNATITRILGREFVHIDGLHIDGNAIAGCTGLLIDSNNAPATRQVTVERLSVSNVGTNGTDGTGIQFGTPGSVTDYQIDAIRLTEFEIANTFTAIRVDSYNALSLSEISHGVIRNANRGIYLKRCGPLSIRHISFGGFTGANPAMIDIASDDNVLIDTCHAESTPSTSSLFCRTSGNSLKAVILKNCTVNEPCQFDGTREIVIEGGYFTEDITIYNGCNITLREVLFAAGKGVVRDASSTGTIRTATRNTDIQSFTASGVWTKPAGAVAVDVICIAGGGGGGSGRRGAAGTVRCGGGGGGGGAMSFGKFAAADLAATETVTVGAGGAGGAAVTSDDTNGNAGGVGNDSRFGTAVLVRAQAPTGGAGGTNATGAAGAPGTGTYTAGAGGAASVTGAAGAVGANSSGASSGGGAGGGITAADASSAGGNGGSNTTRNGLGVPTGGASGVAGGTDTVTKTLSGIPGFGGGGGGATAAGGAGVRGGGGGGGGASLNGTASGAGGAGGGGIVVVVSYF